MLDAEQLYEQSIRSARTNGFVHIEGLANESAARFYAARGFDGIERLYLENARDRYLRWGADGKVRQLEQLHPWLRQGERAATAMGTIEAPFEQLDLAAVIEVSQALSGEIVVEKLIDRFMRAAIEQAGAERALLVAVQGEELRTSAEAIVLGDDVTVQLRQHPACDAVALPDSLIRYSIRTRDPVVLDDAMAQNPFSADPYIMARRARSILCLPLINQGRLIGILYLENSLTPHVFTPNRVTVMKVLASQAAISLENTQAVRALKQSETRYQNLFQAMAVSFFELDYTSGRQILRALRDAGVHDFRAHLKENPGLAREIKRATRIVDVNDQAVALFGRGNKEELLTSVGVFWPDESLDDYVEAVVATVEGNDKFSTETRVRRLDGTLFDAQVTLRYATEDKTRGLAGIIDITERKRAENALRESEERFRDYAETASDWLWEMGPDHKLTMLTPNAFGSSPSARLGTAAWERALDLETEPEKWRTMRATMDAHKPFRDFVYLASGYDGSPMYVRASGKPVFDADGEFLGYRGTGTDATAIVRAQEALRESELRLRSAIDGIPGLVAVLTPSGEVEAVNRQIVEYCGQPLEELKNWGTNGIVHHEDLPHVAEVFTQSIASGIPYRIEQRLRRFDGEYRWFDNRGIPVRDDSGRIVRWYVLLTDIEDRTTALARLQQMQADFARMNRVSVMGELAASLSHEITQPIASARNNARAAQNFMKMQPPDLDEVGEALACVVGDTDRARDIIDRIRDHIKKAPPRKERFDLNAAVNEVIVLARSMTNRHGVSVQTRLSDGLDPVLGDRVQLQQVLLNLMLNAAEAMGLVEEGARDLLISTEQDGAGVRVVVRDTGPGIDS
ncbi:MAG TPA: PAS domain S-box protein, partial [Bradyrhizobium sp.]|nr:PAS domain S-box protein [Bradyrhizobium sp.]